MCRELKEANFVETAWNDDCLSIVIGPKVVGAVFKNICIMSKKKYLYNLLIAPPINQKIFFIFSSIQLILVK